MILAHGGTAGLVVELTGALALMGLFLWAAVRSRRSDHDEGDP